MDEHSPHSRLTLTKNERNPFDIVFLEIKSILILQTRLLDLMDVVEARLLRRINEQDAKIAEQDAKLSHLLAALGGDDAVNAPVPEPLSDEAVEELFRATDDLRVQKMVKRMSGFIADDVGSGA